MAKAYHLRARKSLELLEKRVRSSLKLLRLRSSVGTRALTARRISVNSLSKADRQREDSREFKLLRRQHSAVESAINALEVHGLDRCPDHGIKGFERYVALAVLAKNIHRLGTVLREQQKERQRRKRGPYKKAA